MFVKKKNLFGYFLLGNIQILLSLCFKDLSIGLIWYSINSNSLVGFQSILEKYSTFFYGNKIDINKLLILFLDINIFFLLGVLFLLLPCFLSKSNFS